MASPIQQAYGQLDRYSRRHYGISGNVLLAKLEKGESGGSGKAKSGAGARGWYQFMPGTRQAVLNYSGGKIDPWRSEGEARDAAVLHLTGKLGNAPGLAGYNPGGGQGYVNYILNQKVGKIPSGPSYTPTASLGSDTALPAPNPAATLAQTLQRPQGSVSAPAVPAFAAQVPQPLGYTPPPGVQTQATPDLRQQLEQSIRAPEPYSPLGGVAPGAPGSLGTQAGSYGAAPSKGFKGGYPLGKRGQVIGTPYTGTHDKAFNVRGGSDNWQSENAVDIRVPVGTPVYAESNGTLGNTGSLGQGGRFAGLRVNLQGEDNSYYYAHLSRLAPGIKKGAKVKRGQIIGWTGEANGVPHLHFAIERGDPRKLVQ